jgi:hypothetical protein
MKQITKKQMLKLKGKLGDMDYDLSQLVNSTTAQSTSEPSDTQNTVCKALATRGDKD